MSGPKISVIVVSRNRPASLRRLLIALRFQRNVSYELVVVTNSKINEICPSGLSEGNFKFVPFDQPNISVARNLGIENSSGDLIAFIDDDAIPEPFWLERLLAPFENPNVAVTGGFVRGRNGISFQWKGIETNQAGRDRALAVPPEGKVFEGGGKWFARPQGTNFAFRAETLCELGGFDAQFSFYLDETDVCLRASRRGWSTAICPSAEVQHGFESSDRRARSRIPLDLETEAASKGYFFRKHSPDGQCKEKAIYLDEQRARLVRLLQLGWIGPEEFRHMQNSIDKGLKRGLELEERSPVSIKRENSDFVAYPCFPNKGARSILSNSRDLIEMSLEAATIASTGCAVTLFHFSKTTRFHKRYFDPRGFWVQTGGLWGKSDRNDPIFKRYTTLERLTREESFLIYQRAG